MTSTNKARPIAMQKTLRYGLLRLIAITIVAAMLIVSIAILIYESKTFQPRTAREVRTQLNVVSLNIQSSLDFSDKDSALESLRTLTQDPRFLAAVVFDRHEQRFVEYIAPLSRGFTLPQLPLDRMGDEFTTSHYRANAPIVFDGEVLGTIVAFYQMPPLLERLPQYGIMIFVVALAIMVVAFSLYISVERSIATPLRLLAEKARTIAADEISSELHSANEIRRLEMDFERMVDALQRREVRLREQQMRMQLALDAAEQGVWEIDIDTGLMVWDEHLYTLVGTVPEHFTPTLDNFLNLLSDSDKERVRSAINRTVESGTAESVEYVIHHPIKGERHIQATGKVFRDAMSGKDVVRGVSRDITERVNNERATRESERRFRTLIEQMPVAIGVTDAHGNIILSNQKFIDLLGYSLADVSTMDVWWQVAYPDPEYRQTVQTQWFEHIRVAQESGQSFVPMEAEVLTKSQHKVVVEFHLAIMDNLSVTCFIDLTDRKQAERDIRLLNEQLEDRVQQRTAELEIANRELESFSYSVSHDLRAPLRAISGFGSALVDDYSDRLDDEGRVYLERMMAASLRMSHLIDDLLRFSRLSRTALERIQVDMNELTNEVWSELKESFGNEIGEISLTPLAPCNADRGLLKQVVFNLLNNAIKFSRNSRPRCIEVFNEMNNDMPVYVFKDNGVGFNMDFSGKLFGVFQRLHRAEEFEGTGVGLALCRRVVERHGGTIWAESAPGKGATFRFTIGKI